MADQENHAELVEAALAYAAALWALPIISDDGPPVPPVLIEEYADGGARLFAAAARLPG